MMPQSYHRHWKPLWVGFQESCLRAFGARIGDVRAPFAGIVNYVVGTPPAVEGQPLAMVSRIAAPPQ
jgi:hypothetical protein